MKSFGDTYHGKSVLLTGHTGFKGGWLSLWLHSLGARVHGYALDPLGESSFFTAADVSSCLATDHRADLRDIDRLRTAMREASPRFVFHLAAQPLVRESYRDPLGTFATNLMGTVHLLEVLRQTPSVESVVIVTTDKVYLNREWEFPYREIDPLGGHDPYSASKAAVEIAAASYRSSFLSCSGDASPGLATARAGNVIGGGDWAKDRLVPDCLRAFEQGEAVRLRFPHAVRPWQHVLDALSGYLHLGAALVGAGGARYATAWNFGPDPAGDASVGDVARRLASSWGDGAKVVYENDGDESPHEAGLLRLDSSRARQILGWRPRWTLEESLARTVNWHRAWRDGRGMRMFSLSQIDEYGQSI